MHSNTGTRRTVDTEILALYPLPVAQQRLTVDLEDEVHRAFKAQAALQGVAMVDVVRYLIADLLENEGRFQVTAEKARQAKVDG